MKFTTLTYMTTVFLTLTLSVLAQNTTTSDDSTFTIDPISTTDDFPLPSSTDTPTDIPTNISSFTPISSVSSTPSVTTSRIVSITSLPISSSTTPVNVPSTGTTVSATNGALPTIDSKADKMVIGMFAGLVAAVIL